MAASVVFSSGKCRMPDCSCRRGRFLSPRCVVAHAGLMRRRRRSGRIGDPQVAWGPGQPSLRACRRPRTCAFGTRRRVLFASCSRCGRPRAARPWPPPGWRQADRAGIRAATLAARSRAHSLCRWHSDVDAGLRSVSSACGCSGGAGTSAGVASSHAIEGIFCMPSVQACHVALSHTRSMIGVPVHFPIVRHDHPFLRG
jgi:hypothetical protein